MALAIETDVANLVSLPLSSVTCDIEAESKRRDMRRVLQTTYRYDTIITIEVQDGDLGAVSEAIGDGSEVRPNFFSPALRILPTGSVHFISHTPK